MRKSGSSHVLSLFVFIILFSALILSSCTPAPQITQSIPSVESDPDSTPSPSSSPSSSPFPSPAPTVDSLVLIQEATLFKTDFENGSHLRIRDWNHQWEIRQTTDGNTIYCNLPVDAWVTFTFGLEDWSDYALEVDIQLVRENLDFSYELYTRLGESGGYRATIDANRAGMNFYPPYIDFGGDSIAIQPGEWHTLRVEAVGENFRYFVDDKLFVDVNDDRLLSGKVGVGASPKTEICVDNVRLWAIDKNGPIALENVLGVFNSDSSSGENSRSRYFEKVELLESTNIPLKGGDIDYLVRSSTIQDMNEDGVADAILAIITYPENMPHPIVVLNGDGPINNIATDIFPAGITSIRNSNQIFFIDINNDDRDDLLISEAGIDYFPWYVKDAVIGIAINRGNGIFEDVSMTVPGQAWGLRNYSTAAGDLYNDGIIRIILPSQATDENQEGPKKTGLLFWNGNEFVFQRNWINMSLWWGTENLYSSSFMSVQDIDGDGLQDIYISGTWITPNHRVLYGSETFPSAESLYILPEGPYGYTPWESFIKPDVDFVHGTDVNQVLIKDFDGDGDLDIISVLEDVQNYKPGVFEDKNHPWYTNVHENGGIIYGNIWFQVLRNDGERQFVDITTQGKDLGDRYYISLLPIDFDLDGDIDIVGQYWNKFSANDCKPRWGSTIFINEGNLVFQTIEADEMFPELSAEANQVSWASDCATLGLGVFFPTVITADGMKGLFVAPVDFKSDNSELRILRIQTFGRFHFPD